MHSPRGMPHGIHTVDFGRMSEENAHEEVSTGSAVGNEVW